MEVLGEYVQVMGFMDMDLNEKQFYEVIYNTNCRQNYVCEQFLSRVIVPTLTCISICLFLKLATLCHM
jgi:hypothetical protein